MRTPSRYDEYLLTSHWQEKRKLALKHNFGRCCVCGDRDNLQVHHLNYDSLYHESLGDLSVLCANCHEIYHFVMPKLKIKNPKLVQGMELSELDMELLKI